MKTEICNQLRRAFPACAVYASVVEQGLTRPCFFVRESACRYQSGVSGLTVRERDWEILFYPETRGSDCTDWMQLGEQLYAALRTVGGKRCLSVHQRVEDGLLIHQFSTRETLRTVSDPAPAIETVEDIMKLTQERMV